MTGVEAGRPARAPPAAPEGERYAAEVLLVDAFEDDFGGVDESLPLEDESPVVVLASVLVSSFFAVDELLARLSVR